MKIITLIFLLFTIVLSEKQVLLIGGSLDQNSHILNLYTGKHVALITAAGYIIFNLLEIILKKTED
jgi:hypothetical protein